MSDLPTLVERLAQEAGLAWTDIRMPGGKLWTTDDAKLQRFAALVAEECIQVAQPDDSYQDEWFKAKADAVKRIRERFSLDAPQKEKTDGDV